MKEKRMREGDEFLCKKSINFNNGEIVFTCNKWYKVINIPVKEPINICYFYDDNTRQCGFTKPSLKHFLDFDEYFCNKKDLRRLKLEEINERR